MIYQNYTLNSKRNNCTSKIFLTIFLVLGVILFMNVAPVYAALDPIEIINIYPGDRRASVQWSVPVGVIPDGYIIIATPTAGGAVLYIDIPDGTAVFGTIEILTNNVEYAVTVLYYIGAVASPDSKIWYVTPPLTVIEPPISKLPSSFNDSNCGGNCVAPTLGLDENQNRVVDYGFGFNGNLVQVENWYTEFPLINATIGKVNLIETKTYENYGINNISYNQYCIGAEERGQSMNECEVLIEVHYETNGTITDIGVEEIIITDKDNLIDNESVTALAYVSKCMEDGDSLSCVKTDLFFTFREAPLYQMIIIQTVDNNGNTQNFHFNEGIYVEGQSLNPADTIQTFRGIYTQIDRLNEIWIDEDGIEYEKNSFDSFNRITPYPDYVCNDTPLDEIMNGGDRNNCHFRAQLISMWK